MIHKKSLIMIVALAMLFIGVNSYALVLPVSGTVYEYGTNKVVPGAKLVWYMAGKTITVYTNSLGKYSFSYNHWCDTKTVVVTKTGYYTKWFQVGEGSCCSCNPDCPPAYGNIGCRKTFTVNFTIFKKATASLRMDNLEGASFLKANDGQLIKTLLAFWWIDYCTRNVCNYECLAQAVEDFVNGPEYMFGRPTRPDIELSECPDVPNFVDFVNNWLEEMWEFYYGDNFPDEAGE